MCFYNKNIATNLVKFIFIIIIFTSCDNNDTNKSVNTLPQNSSVEDFENSAADNKLHAIYENEIEEEENKQEKNHSENESSEKKLLNKLLHQNIILTKHAKCRMSCRNVSDLEIKEALTEGHLNIKKSDRFDKPCPTYAIEDRSMDGQLLRIVCADCDKNTKIITVIDLENEYSCNCY
jgi:hypothetical protein